MNPELFIFGKRPEHGHGDDGCFSMCLVWKYDLAVLKVQFELVTARMDEVKRLGDSKAGPDRMVTLTRRLHTLDSKIKAKQGK